MKIWKRNAVIGAVLVFVCAAVYLNWAYEKKTAEEAEAQQPGLISDVSLLNTQSTEIMAETQPEAEPALTLSDEAKAYFASARLTRQEGRDSALEILQEAAAFAETDEAADYDAVSADIQTIANYALKESEIEALITAKGYADCVAMMSAEGLTIIVSAPESGLETTDVAKITDIATTNTGFTASALRIIEVN